MIKFGYLWGGDGRQKRVLELRYRYFLHRSMITEALFPEALIPFRPLFLYVAFVCYFVIPNFPEKKVSRLIDVSYTALFRRIGNFICK